MSLTIGYLIPEFPGQTHIFFWRERKALQELGIATALISTRPPQPGLIAHKWSQEALGITSYLYPFQLKDYWIAIAECFKSGPSGWLRCLSVIFSTENISLTQRLRLLAMILIAGKLLWLSRQHGWTHLHVHSCADSANIALLARQLSDLSYSLSLHGPLEDYGNNQKQKWQFAKFAIVITKKLYEEVHQALKGSLPNSIQIAAMGVNLEAFTRSSPYLPWKNSQPCRLFSCGRLNPCKGHAYLIQAVALLQQQGISVKLDIAGEDEQGGSGYHQQLQALIEELDLSDSVRLLGAVSEEVVRQSLETAHVFVLASLNEPLGVAIMEAMAMETPVVATSAGGVKELVDHGNDGILVQPENPAAITDAVLKIIYQPDLALKLGRAARNKICNSFHHKISAEKIALFVSE